MYKRWFTNSIEIPLRSISDPGDRIQFILGMKMEFIANNRNVEATMMVGVIDTLIEKEKFAMQFKTTPSESIKEEEVNMDYSGNSIAERIAIMKELGILDYLESKIFKEIVYFSPSKLATVISSFSGVQQESLQSYLNPIYSKDANKKKSPLTKTNTDKAKNKLINMGFKSTNK